MLVILYRPVLTLSLPILYMYVDFWVFWRTRSTMLRPPFGWRILTRHPRPSLSPAQRGHPSPLPTLLPVPVPYQLDLVPFQPALVSIILYKCLNVYYTYVHVHVLHVYLNCQTKSTTIGHFYTHTHTHTPLPYLLNMGDKGYR